jgi:thiamine pyrophosphate-dependent acetolactate synthase large subunit-like protein
VGSVERFVYDDVAAAVAAEGVERVYGVLGDGNLHLSLALERQGITWVSARHEQGALAMADGEARTTGGLAAASVTHGPGLTNAATGLTAAALARSPVLFLLGDTPHVSRHHGQDIPQEPFVRATGAGWHNLRGPAQACQDVAIAARAARVERRPVALNLPSDRQTESSASPQVAPQAFAPVPPAAPTAADVDRLVAELGDAERVLVLGGRGALDASEDLVELAERCGAWLGTTLLTKDLFTGHRSDLGVVGGFSTPASREVLRGIDLVLAFGASLNKFTTGGGRVCPAARWVQVEADAQAVGLSTSPDVFVVADAQAAARALAARLPASRPRHPAESPIRLDERPGTHTGRPSTGLDPRTAVETVGAALPAGFGAAVGVGHYSGLAALSLTVADPRDRIHAWSLGSVGLALSTGLGASLARPDRPQLVVEGDGGLLMNPSELDTLARLDLPVLVLVLDDGAFGAEVHLLRKFGEDDRLARFPRRDIASLAASLGVRSATATSPEQLDAALESLLPLTGPRLLHVHTDLEVIHAEVFEALSI